MAKTRAQRKAERRAREAQDRSSGRESVESDAQAQHDTQVPISGEVAEVEAVEAGIAAHAPEQALETPDAPKPRRSERRAAERARKQQEKKSIDEQERKQRERVTRKEKKAVQERQRGAVIGFIASCWAELKKVQWPDRDTLVQASAVTLVFVAIAAAYLGALDAAFNWMIQRVL
jgi:preprotein translocase SecE subunit